MGKRIKYKIGDVFLIPLTEELYGVGRVMRKDYDTVLIETYQILPLKDSSEYAYEKMLQKPPFPMGWCYNDGLKSGSWEIIDYQPVPEQLEMPYFWGQDAGDMKYYIRKGTEKVLETVGERIEISKEDILKYSGAGIGSEGYEQKIYIRRLTEAGLLQAENEEANQETAVQEMGILDEDVAADVEAVFMEALESGCSGKKATKTVLKEFSEELEDEEDRNVVYLALAELQLRENCLEEDIKKQALDIIESGADLERWQEAEEKDLKNRETVLNELKERLINW